MGSHLTKDGNFKSDKYDWCPEGFFALKFSDPKARISIFHFACRTKDKELKEDLFKALDNARMKEKA